jgi:colicin import membrane protein
MTSLLPGKVLGWSAAGHVVLVLGLWLVAQLAFTPNARLVADVAPLQTVLVDSSSLAKRARVADLQPAVLPQVPAPVIDETPPQVELKPSPEVALPKPKPVVVSKPKMEPAVEPKVPPKADAKAAPAEALRVPPTLVPRPDPAAARAARERLAAEAALEAQLAEENSRATAIRSGAQDEWNFRVRERIESNWYRPASARRGLQCRVAVTLVPGGTVVSAVVEACNGDAAVRESLRAAVLKSSPLPLPKDMRLFERKLVLEFTPDE